MPASRAGRPARWPAPAPAASGRAGWPAPRRARQRRSRPCSGAGRRARRLRMPVAPFVIGWPRRRRWCASRWRRRPHPGCRPRGGDRSGMRRAVARDGRQAVVAPSPPIPRGLADGACDLLSPWKGGHKEERRQPREVVGVRYRGQRDRGVRREADAGSGSRFNPRSPESRALRLSLLPHRRVRFRFVLADSPCRPRDRCPMYVHHHGRAGLSSPTSRLFCDPVADKRAGTPAFVGRARDYAARPCS